MRELEYPFDPEWIMKKKIKIKKKLLTNGNGTFLNKKIAILGGSTTNEVKDILELFLLNNGIKPLFYESEYNQFYEDGMFDNPQLTAFCPEVIYIHTSSRNIREWPSAGDAPPTAERKLSAVFNWFAGLWDHLAEKYRCSIIQNNFELPFYRLLGNQDACLLQGKVSFVSRLNDKVHEYAR